MPETQIQFQKYSPTLLTNYQDKHVGQVQTKWLATIVSTDFVNCAANLVQRCDAHARLKNMLSLKYKWEKLEKLTQSVCHV